VATGSLGLGLPVGVGIALAGKRLDRLPYRVWVLCGDSELAEGSVWEAFAHAAHHRLDNLVTIVDVNRLGQSGETMLGWDTASYAARARAFGWKAIEVDGHDVRAVDVAYRSALVQDGRPAVVFARTRKGRGVAAVEDREGWHGKPLADPDSAIRELGGRRDLIVRPARRVATARGHRFPAGRPCRPAWALGAPVATRRAYGEALADVVGADPRVIALDGEVSNSTYSGLFKDRYPERFVEMFVSEQQMIATAIGLAARGWVPFASSFTAFFARAFDFIRMAAISRADLRLVGSHVGVSVGEDGPSQMALEDIASLRALPASTILYPACANQTVQLARAMLDQPGIVYLRTTRMDLPVLYAPDQQFPVGGSRLIRSGEHDDVTLVGAGVTLHEALAAADRLAAAGVHARVLDAYSVKPVDTDAVADAAAATGRVVVAEDHSVHGGLGAAVLEALAEAEIHARVRLLGVREVPCSGTPRELLAWAGIDGSGIAAAAIGLLEAQDRQLNDSDATNPASSWSIR
jgi:transketolase